jgi:hypothetical protein
MNPTSLSKGDRNLFIIHSLKLHKRMKVLEARGKYIAEMTFQAICH